MKKNRIRLTEAQLDNIIHKSIKRVLNEIGRPFPHKDVGNRQVGDFPIKQPEWVKDKRWEGWNGEDPEWLMKQKGEQRDALS